jgi:hypothetical protein
MISRRAFAYYVSAGVICASILHILAMLGYAPLDMGTVATILLLIAVPAVLAMMAHADLRARRAAGTRTNRVDLFAEVPEWGRRLFVAVFIYAGVNFAAFLVVTGGGGVEQRTDGRYVLSEHGNFIRELDAKGVRALHVWDIRVITGSLLPFLVLPGLYLFLAPSASSGERKPHTPAA